MRLHFLGVTQALGLEITLTESPHDFCSALKGDTVSCTVCWLQCSRRRVCSRKEIADAGWRI
jgi:hypothetical protein